MKNFTLLFALMVSLSSFSQKGGEVVFFNNSGYQFHVVLNGVKQNEVAESNVRVQGLTDKWYGCLVIADDNTFSLEKNIVVKQDTVITYQVYTKKGKYKLRFFSETPVEKAPQTSEQTVIVYHATETPVMETVVTTTTTETTTTSSQNEGGNVSSQTNVGGNEAGFNMSVNVSETGNTTSGTPTSNVETTTTGGEEHVSISMQVSENGMSMNVNASGMEGSSDYEETSTMSHTETVNGTVTSSTTTTSTITTTTSTSSSTGTGGEVYTQVETTGSDRTDVIDCYISEGDAETAIERIENTTFSDDQLMLAKRLGMNKCLNLEQISRITDVLTFSDDRMEFVKAAYPLCTEQSQYYTLEDKFEFSEDKKELLDFIEQN